MNAKEKWIGIISGIVILIVIMAAFQFVNIISDSNYYENQYNSLKNEYDSLYDKHSNSVNDYNTLVNNYNSLNADYNNLASLVAEYSKLPIDHSMAMTYSEIREQIQPQYTSWWSTYYYDGDSADYAAYVSAHDLGRQHWPSIENNYYGITGSYLTHDAHTIISEVISIIDISGDDSDTEKIEKILDFISTFITYQSDLNNEFLFPAETITFRSGDCDDFSILAATLLEEAGIESAIGLFTNVTEDSNHCMVLVKLSDLGDYGYWYYDDLTDHGLSEGKWVILEPQTTIDNQQNENLVGKWGIIAVSEIPN